MMKTAPPPPQAEKDEQDRNDDDDDDDDPFELKEEAQKSWLVLQQQQQTDKQAMNNSSDSASSSSSSYTPYNAAFNNEMIPEQHWEAGLSGVLGVVSWCMMKRRVRDIVFKKWDHPCASGCNQSEGRIGGLHPDKRNQCPMQKFVFFPKLDLCGGGGGGVGNGNGNKKCSALFITYLRGPEHGAAADASVSCAIGS
jgi:hypothetical protein